MNGYMLDTNICIYAINRKIKGLNKIFQTVCKQSRIYVSSITLAQLEHIVFKSSRPGQNQIALAAFLAPFEILPFDDRCAFAFGQIARDLYRKGTPIGVMDMLIAAHALTVNSVLVTHNTSEFSRVDHLMLEDWVKRVMDESFDTERLENS